MRSDMFEVIIERPRWASRFAYGKKGRLGENPTDPEMSLKREPMSLGRGMKSLNENLAPLRRFLQSRVGRPWNKVRAEICEHLSMNSAVQKHVLDHLSDFVEEHPVLIDGVPHDPIARGPRRDQYRRFGAYGRDMFYVCPRTGLLKRAPSKARRRRPRQDPSIKLIDDQREARQINGIWYMVTFAPVPLERARIDECYDVLLKLWLTPQMTERFSGALYRSYGDTEKYARAKRQLSKHEIRVLLANEHE